MCEELSALFLQCFIIIIIIIIIIYNYPKSRPPEFHVSIIIIIIVIIPKCRPPAFHVVDHSAYYSRLSLSRLRLSRTTAYLEEKIWSLL